MRKKEEKEQRKGSRKRKERGRNTEDGGQILEREKRLREGISVHSSTSSSMFTAMTLYS